MNGNALTLPISRGSVDIDTLSGRIQHQGGLRFEVAGQSVEATDLVVEPARDVVTAKIGGERVPFLGLDIKRPRSVPVSGTFVLPATATTITGEAVPALNDRIGLDIFDGGLTLGRLTVSAERG